MPFCRSRCRFAGDIWTARDAAICSAMQCSGMQCEEVPTGSEESRIQKHKKSGEFLLSFATQHEILMSINNDNVEIRSVLQTLAMSVTLHLCFVTPVDNLSSNEWCVTEANHVAFSVFLLASSFGSKFCST